MNPSGTHACAACSCPAVASLRQIRAARAGVSCAIQEDDPWPRGLLLWIVEIGLFFGGAVLWAVPGPWNLALLAGVAIAGAVVWHPKRRL